MLSYWDTSLRQPPRIPLPRETDNMIWGESTLTLDPQEERRVPSGLESVFKAAWEHMGVSGAVSTQHAKKAESPDPGHFHTWGS